jgi:hypothetical protein
MNFQRLSCITYCLIVTSTLATVITILESTTNTQPWWMLSLLRLVSFPMFLHELIRGAGSSPFAIWMDRLTHLFESGGYLFDVFEFVRLIQATFLFPLAFIGGLSSKKCEGLEDMSNPDIVGAGVRLSMYILFFAVFASLFIGSFHSGPSGTKELGVATLISTYTHGI